jgi:hypothetical protein
MPSGSDARNVCKNDQNVPKIDLVETLFVESSLKMHYFKRSSAMVSACGVGDREIESRPGKKNNLEFY